jgi:hypothetical protein
VLITVPVVDALAELPAAGAELGELGDAVAALLHPAASSAEARGIPTLTGTGIRVSNERIIVIISFRATGAALGHAARAPLSSC